MPFEYSPPKKSTLLVSMVLEIIGLIIGITGAFGQITPYLETIIGPDVINVDLICIITGFILTAIAWFIFYLGVKLRGV
ncbi:MAG: hypothetical protein ACFFAS_01515 [Promethearchaeota archaeon]